MPIEEIGHDREPEDTFGTTFSSGARSKSLLSCEETLVIETECTRIMEYTKPIIPILVENSVKVYATNLFVLLPQHDKFMVKERVYDPTVGCARTKLVMKLCSTEPKWKGMQIHTGSEIMCLCYL